MKKRIFVAFAMVVVLVLALAGTAYATWADSGFVNTPQAGNSTTSNPHVDYRTQSVKCAVCHAVHGAASGGEILLRTTKGNACSFCHVSATAAFTVVYGGYESNYTVALDNAHSYLGAGGTTSNSVACSDCHTVHGAGTASVGGVARNLRAITTSNWSNNRAGYSSYTVTGASVADVSTWCSGCHPYLTRAFNQRTHIMTAPGASYGNPSAANSQSVVAWASSADCANCHDDTTYSGLTTGLGSKGVAFPHITDGARFMLQAPYYNSGVATKIVGDTTIDGACLKCHKGAQTTGVGSEF